ncbi:hypothetical protein JNW91_27660, partial [Micromonospora sp. STR1_7]|nr:hypothetical protein [Micromonospora parastrephiae]
MQVGSPSPAGQPLAHQPPPGRANPWAVVAAVLVGFWTVGVTVATQTGGWVTDQVLLGFGRDRVGWLWPVLALATVVLVGTPALLLTVLPRSAPVRATGRVWLAAALALGVLTLPRLVPQVHHEAYLVTLAAVAALAALTVRWSARRSGVPGSTAAPYASAAPPAAAVDGPEPAGPRSRRPGAVPLLAVAAGLALLLPWAWLGALGGLLETVLALAAATAIGTLAADAARRGLLGLLPRLVLQPVVERHRVQGGLPGHTAEHRPANGDVP